MPVSADSLPNLDQVFQIESFKFMDIKTILAYILAHLGELDAQMLSVNESLLKIEMPDVSGILERLSNCETNVT